METSPILLAIMGPTGSGKSLLAEQWAEELNATLINADTFHIYKDFDIGTNKPQNPEKYKLINIKSPLESFGVGEWVLSVSKLLEELWTEKKNVIVVGGTGFYIRALFEEWKDLQAAPSMALRKELNQKMDIQGVDKLFERLKEIDPLAASKIDPHNKARVQRALEKALEPQALIQFALPPFKKRKVGLHIPRETLWEILEKRTDSLLQLGWTQEVQKIISQGVPQDSPAMRAIGYRTIIDFLENRINNETMRQNIIRDTKRYAKRQVTWLRSEPALEWIKIESLQDVLKLSSKTLLEGYC